MTRSLSAKQILLLSFLIVLAAVNTCAYTPAIPAIALYFHQAINKTQTLIVISLLAHLFAPLGYAALGNLTTRQKAIQTGLAICISGDLCALLAALLQHFPLLMLAMFLLTFGGNMGMTMALTIMREQQYSHLEKPMTLSMISFAILPGLCIAIAGAILQASSWPMIFLALLAYHALLLLSLPILPQACKQATFSRVKIISLQALTQLSFWLITLMAGCFSGLIYSFTALAPKIAIQDLGVTPLAFGLWSNLPALGMFIGSLLALKFTGQQFFKIMHIAIALCIGCVLLLLISLHFHVFFAWNFFVFIAISYIGIQFAFPFLAARALRLEGDHASHSALFTMLHFLVSSQLVNLANHLPLKSNLALVSIYAVAIIILLFALLLLRYCAPHKAPSA